MKQQQNHNRIDSLRATIDVDCELRIFSPIIQGPVYIINRVLNIRSVEYKEHWNKSIECTEIHCSECTEAQSTEYTNTECMEHWIYGALNIQSTEYTEYWKHRVLDIYIYIRMRRFRKSVQETRL